jgi:endo-beta-N-acetylglucosaminidase D
MRATEFINEAADKLIKKASRYSLPHAKQMVDLDQYYGFYRLGIAMASAPTHSAPSKGPAKDVPTLWPYSDGDEEIINKAIKNQGIGSGKDIIKQGKSEELPGTNVVSPVANWMQK